MSEHPGVASSRSRLSGTLAYVRRLWTKGIPSGVALALAVVLITPQLLPWMAQKLLPQSQPAAGDGLELTAFIEKVKADLEKADRDGVAKGESPLLQLQDVELVVNFVVQSHAESDVKLVTVNGSAISGEERSQQITLHLKPVPPQTVTVGPAPGPISGAQVQGQITPPATQPGRAAP
jgi:hypothetical protein